MLFRSKERTRNFIQRIRNCVFNITSPDFDLYALNGEVEGFCTKQFLSKTTRNNLLLIIEELLLIYKPLLKTIPVELTVAYSEKNETLALICECGGSPGNPLESDQLVDDLGVTLIKRFSTDIAYAWDGHKNKIVISIQTSRGV